MLSMFLASHPNHQLVFMRIWQIEPTYLINALRDFYEEAPQNISRILDIAQDLKVNYFRSVHARFTLTIDQIMDHMLEVPPFNFALDAASLASRREYLNLDKWLSDQVAAHGADFLHGVVAFLDMKMESEKISRISVPQVEPRTMPLNPQTIAIFLRFLRNRYVVPS